MRHSRQIDRCHSFCAYYVNDLVYVLFRTETLEITLTITLDAKFWGDKGKCYDGNDGGCNEYSRPQNARTDKGDSGFRLVQATNLSSRRFM
jgi:hypothetical protein